MTLVLESTELLVRGFGEIVSVLSYTSSCDVNYIVNVVNNVQHERAIPL